MPLFKAQARAVESLVRAKMQHKEFIILCLEDCSDWSNATTRRVVMQVRIHPLNFCSILCCFCEQCINSFAIRLLERRTCFCWGVFSNVKGNFSDFVISYLF